MQKNWNDYNADTKDEKFEQAIDKLKEKLINDKNGNVNGLINDLIEIQHKIIGIHVFCPHEFDFIRNKYDEALNEFREWLLQQSVDIQKTSENLKKLINNNYKTKSGLIKYSGSYKILDSLIEVSGKNIAIEVETSNNTDNGISTLKYAIQKKKADFGIMIVPYKNKTSRRADSRLAISKLDSDSDLMPEGRYPIFIISVLQNIDIVSRLR